MKLSTKIRCIWYVLLSKPLIINFYFEEDEWPRNALMSDKNKKGLAANNMVVGKKL